LKITPDTLLNPRWAALLAGVWLAVAAPAAAQSAVPAGLPNSPDAAAAAAGPEPIVEEISLRIEGPQQISTESIMAHVLLHEKTPYNQALVDKSVESLEATKQFNFVRTDREVLPSGGVRLIIHLFPNPRVSAVVFKGNKEYSQVRLLGEIKTVAGDVVDQEQLTEDQVKLLDFYHKKGYMQVKVSYTLDTNPNTGTAVATFQIDEGPAVEIVAIKFAGNDHISSGKLADQIQTVTHKFLISIFTGGGIFKREDFLDDLDTLRKYYKSHGFLDVDIPEDEVKYDYPSPGRLALTIAVHEGRQYRIGKNITIEGNTIFQTATLKALLTIKPGDVFSPEEVDKNRDAIRDFYGKAGYLDTFVRADRLPDLDTGDIGIDFVVLHSEVDEAGNQRVSPGESDKFYVEGIDIEGNTKTRSTVIVRELTLAPGDVFDTDRMKTSEDRLRNTGYFENDVTLSPGDTNIPGKRNLRINLTEAKTLTAEVGAGFDPVQGVAAFIDFQESNFDLFNSKTYFRGGGQKAHVRFTIGTNILSVQVDYEYPWLFERRLDTGISLFHSEDSYSSDTYNEEDTGFTVWIRKPVIEYIDATLSYTLEDILLKDLTAQAPPPVFAEQGDTTVSKVGLDFVRSKGLDSLVAPTTGQREEFLTSVAGGPIGGQTNFYRFEGHANFWIPTFKFSNQVLSFAMRAGTVSGYDGKDVPYAERYFLGGDYDLRGFANRWVGPKDANMNDLSYGEPLGGNSMALVQTEYSIELFKDFRFAVFHDIGFVNANSFDMSPGQYRQDVGVGFHFFLLHQPIRIDFGYPLNPDQFQSHSIRPSFSLQAVY
jgi:outer membrane protein insertion porin family